ncbi:MAG TPA: S53 family peptidase [Acidobacteriaceae bacterium]|nr:S53 family peptidase [Acidobacteriaceae bacterium]
MTEPKCGRRMDGKLHHMSIPLVLGWIAALLLGGLSLAPASALTVLPSRINGPIRSAQMQVVKGTVPPRVAEARDQGQLSGSTPIENMSLVFALSPAQQADLKNLLQQQQTVGSPMYHQWLKPGQFAARYGVSPQDLAKVAAWLRSQGFTVTAIPPSNDRVVFSGTAAQVNAVFQTQLHQYLFHGKQRWANSTDISLPQAIAGIALGVQHLNTFRPEPHAMKRLVHATPQSPGRPASQVGSHYTLTDQSGTVYNFIAPADAQTIYDLTGLYNSNFTGTDQTLAIVGQTDIVQHQSDIANFRKLSGLNASNLPTQILVPNSGTATAYVGDLEEADIDVEWSGAIAKNANILYVTVGNSQNYSVLDSLQYAIETPLVNNTNFAPVISISYGACEAGFAGSSAIGILEQSLEKANSQGQTVFAAAGDSGSADCDSGTNSNGQTVAASNGLAVDYPPSSQYVTAVGGTSFSGDIGDQSKYWNSHNTSSNGSAISYIPETTWNDTPDITGLNNNGSLGASGGGASSCVTTTGTTPNITCTGGFSKPSWQVGTGVPNDGKRDVPDVSLAADPNHDGYVLCTEEVNSANTAFTGPSCVYPVGSNQVAYFDANDSGYLYGGTSIAAPQMAAIITLMNQEAGNAGGVGNMNPILYQVAQTTPGAFHDVTTGNNAVVCVAGSPNCTGNSGGYGVMSCCSAGTGYDMATGLGSVDAAALGAVWPRLAAVNGQFSLVLNPDAVTVSPGGSGTTSVVLSPSSAGPGTSGFTGTVDLTCSNLPAGVTCSFSNSSVSLVLGTAQTVTLTLNASSSAAATSVARMRHPLSPLNSEVPVRMAFAGILGFALLGLGRRRRYFPSRWMAVLLLFGGLMAATCLTACAGGSAGGGGGGGTPVTQTVTVTGTSGTTVASTSIVLTVT